MNEISTELALPAPEAMPALFGDVDKLNRIIGNIEAEARSHVADTSTKKGRDAIASLAFKLARSKTALDAAGKELNAKFRAQIDVVDAERRKIRERFDALKDEVRAPLTAWEKAEEDRVEGHKATIGRIVDLGNCVIAGAPVEPEAALERLKRGKIDERFEEFEAEAHRAYAAATEKLEAAVEAERKRAAEQAELERLRAEAAAREEADRLRREAEEAEARRVAAEKAETERQARIEQEKREAAEVAARAAEEKVRQEAAAQAKAAADREAELQRQIEESKRREERAAQAERDRIAAEQKAEHDARAKREADMAHRSRIRSAISKAIVSVNSVDKKDADLIAAALMDGAIPHCSVSL